MKNNPSHKENIVALKRIEGQIRGIQRMIEEERYCVDILIQMRSVIKAIMSVKNKIYQRHLEHCVVDSLKGKSDAEKKKKIDEIIDLLSKKIGF